MTAYRFPRVTSSTMGTPSSPFEEFRTDYVHGGSKRDDPAGPGTAKPSAEALLQRHQAEKKWVQEIRAAEPGLPIAEIARRMKLGRKTVARYVRELDGPGYQVRDQSAVKREKMARFTAALAADPDPDRPNVAAACRAAGIAPATGYGYLKELREREAQP